MNGHRNLPGEHRESHDAYSGEVFRLGEWRVIVCKDGIQWILQHRTSDWRLAGGRWRGRHYCRQLSTLLRLWAAATGDDGAVLAALLPVRIERLSHE